MNPQLTEYIYLNYQPNQYYSKYIKENQQRDDARKCQQMRALKISTGANNSVTVSRGNTIIIAQLSTSIQQVVFNPISCSYGKPLLNICVTSSPRNAKRFNKFQKDQSKYIQSYISQFIQWKQIEEQLVYQSVEKSARFAHTGQITVRVADTDGCLRQTALLAVQMLLWTSQLDNIKESVENCSSVGKFILKLTQLWFPIKYCEILDELIADPSSSQQQASNYEITFITTLKSKSQKRNCYHIVNVHKKKALSHQTIQALQQLYLVSISKLAFDIQAFQKLCSTTSKQQSITISGL